MKKLFLFLCSLVGIATWGQTSQLQNPGNIVQNDVTTRIVNGRAETTFSVAASASEMYFIKFWLMGVRHENDTYSSYLIKVDNDSVGQILTDRGEYFSR